MMLMRLVNAGLTTLLWASPSIAVPFFLGLGDLPGGTFSSGAGGVGNLDGSAVVVGGSQSSGGNEAFRWTAADGLLGLGGLPGGPAGFHSIAHGVSVDGSVVVGAAQNSDLSVEAFRWTPDVGMVGLGSLSDDTPSSDARAVSADGRVVVGVSDIDGQLEAFRWTAADGMIGLGGLPGGTGTSIGQDVSADGSVVVGSGNSGSNEAFRWTAADGMIGLGTLPGGGAGNSNALGVSGDGRVIVGVSSSADSPNSGEAFRWTLTDGMVALGDLVGGVLHSIARDTTGDGSIVVGMGTTVSGSEAFIWDELNGFRSLKSVLMDDLGLDVSGWTLEDATGISANGQFVSGRGINPDGNTEAWVAAFRVTSMPEPSTILLLILGVAVLAVVGWRQRRCQQTLVSHSYTQPFQQIVP